jgi:hypothetical protein
LGKNALGIKTNNMGYKMKGFSGFFTNRGPVATDDTKEGNVSTYHRKNKQYVDKDKTIPLDPGYEDTEKIQKVQREGITPHSQKFGDFKALKEVKVSTKKKKD